jgi:LysM repeat protein
MKRLVITTLLSAYALLGFSQETYYIKVEPSCMDRFEYHINGESKGIPYIAYRLHQGEMNHLFLEVGSEATGYQLSTPPLTDCRNLAFSTSFVDKINKGEIVLFIVRKDDIGYNISPVNLASSQSFTGRVLKFHSYDVDFQADVENATPDVNLTDLDASNEIYIGGNGGMKCLKEYYFHKVPKESCKPAVGLILVPELGLVKEITGKSSISEYESTLHLVRVNDVSVDTYIESICAKSQQKITMGAQYEVEDIESDATSTFIPTTYSSNDVIYAPVTTYESSDAIAATDGVSFTEKLESRTISAINTTSAAPVVRAKKEVKPTVNTSKNIETKPLIVENATSEVIASNAKPESYEMKVEKIATPAPAIKCKEVGGKDFHVVQQGETMYSIARRYGLRVEQIQQWNTLGQSTVISPCGKLRILPTEVPTSFETKDLLVAKGAVTTEKTLLKKEEKASTPAPFWKKEKSKLYEAKKGDTYYSIAQRYGYTVDRLLEMNGLEESDAIKIGQKLQVSDCNCPADSKLNKAAPKSYDIAAAAPKETLVARGLPIKEENKEPKKEVKKEPITPSFKRQTVHIVQEDDTIQSIAKKYGLSIDQLSLINYLEKNEILIPNQRLFVD